MWIRGWSDREKKRYDASKEDYSDDGLVKFTSPYLSFAKAVNVVSLAKNLLGHHVVQTYPWLSLKLRYLQQVDGGSVLPLEVH